MTVYYFLIKNLFSFLKKKWHRRSDMSLCDTDPSYTYQYNIYNLCQVWAPIPLAPQSLPGSLKLEVAAPRAPYKPELVTRQLCSYVSTFSGHQQNCQRGDGDTDC